MAALVLLSYPHTHTASKTSAKMCPGRFSSFNLDGTNICTFGLAFKDMLLMMSQLFSLVNLNERDMCTFGLAFKATLLIESQLEIYLQSMLVV